MTLQDKVAVVTGAGGPGCGRAISLRFAAAGARIVVSDLDDGRAQETLRQIESQGGRAAVCQADVRIEEDVRRLIDFAVHQFGGVDVLVNNASAPYRPGEPLDHWADIVQTDLLGAMYATRRAIDAMRS